jgi:hypothetical protein
MSATNDHLTGTCDISEAHSDEDHIRKNVLDAIDDVIARADSDMRFNGLSRVSSVTLMWLQEVKSAVKQVLKDSAE